MSLYVHSDVTAVKLYKNIILTGIGSSVGIFEKATSKFLGRIQCLRGQKIYGFLPLQNSHHVLVFGGKQFAMISIEYCKDSYDANGLWSRVLEPIVCNDWLHSAAEISEDTVALLTAHNTVQVWKTSTLTLLHEHQSPHNSILYSGLLLLLCDDILVFAGTVFSEVIIHIPSEDKPLHRLTGHRGVIFSISCYPQKGIIVSTSDDRSVRIWSVNPLDPSLILDHNTKEYWKNVTIVCKHEVYGHTARVMRSCITNDFIISVGEDSALCFWGYDGKLLKKNVTHQNSAIWALDADSDYIVTGGGDGAVILHPLTMALEYGNQELLTLKSEIQAVPKKIAFTARNNIVALDESNDVIHYVNMETKTADVHKLDHGSTNKFLCLSSCKQLIAVANMSGKLDVFAESCKDDQCLINILSTTLHLGTILSMQWLGNRHLVFCTSNGVVTVICSDNYTADVYTEFVLPFCKERWLTAAAMEANKHTFICGDRCGNIHIFVKGCKHPVKTFNKVHGRYGPTSITIKGNEFITTGRDGTIKYFRLHVGDKCAAKYMSSKDLEFQWAEKFVDRENNVICGFKERVFVVYNVKDNVKLLEVPCGGGHRTWDLIRYVAKVRDEYDEFMKLIFVKNNDIFTHTFQMSKIVSRTVVNSFHSKEINCLRSYRSEFDTTVIFNVTGGEDTTLRISKLELPQHYCDEVIIKHLSNVRTLKIIECDEGFFIISAGGRAQICINKIDVTKTETKVKLSSQELVNYLIKGTDKERKNNQTWRNSTVDFDPETRIMDLDYLIMDKEKILIFAGCSDAYLRVFSFTYQNGDVKFLTIGEMKHQKTCVLKTSCVKILNRDILITCTTRGEVSLWNITNLITCDNLKPFFTTRTNKNGINAIDTVNISDKEMLIATGGDDNAVHMILIEITDLNEDTATLKHNWSTDKFHCSQITGLKLVDNILLTTSIDQRITMSQWLVENSTVQCNFYSQTYSDISDIQGINILDNSSNSVRVCVFGKGMEVVEMPKPEKH